MHTVFQIAAAVSFGLLFWPNEQPTWKCVYIRKEKKRTLPHPFCWCYRATLYISTCIQFGPREQGALPNNSQFIYITQMCGAERMENLHEYNRNEIVEETVQHRYNRTMQRRIFYLFIPTEPIEGNRCWLLAITAQCVNWYLARIVAPHRPNEIIRNSLIFKFKKKRKQMPLNLKWIGLAKYAECRPIWNTGKAYTTSNMPL